MDAGLKVLQAVRARWGLPVLTDVHDAGQAREAATVVDVIQIPAFLCRQTDLLLAAGETGAVVNVKKGQFLAPWDMANVAAKVASTGNDRILLTERGVSFGYNTLVADMRSPADHGAHRLPGDHGRDPFRAAAGRPGQSSGGQREFAPVMARAAVSLGIAGVFIETHEDPDRAPSDGPNMIPLAQMPALVASLMAFDRLAKADPPASHGLPRRPARGPGPLEIVPAQPAGHIDDLADEIEPRHPLRRHRPPVKRRGIDAPQRHLGRPVALRPDRHQPPVPDPGRHAVQRRARQLRHRSRHPRRLLEMPRQPLGQPAPQHGPQRQLAPRRPQVRRHIPARQQVDMRSPPPRASRTTPAEPPAPTAPGG
jgi:2-dehydro-3-deoxyphosphooctonate aldolase (KDO 8-P synthase)